MPKGKYMILAKQFLQKIYGIGALLMLLGCQSQQQADIPQYDTINVVENLVIDENSVPIFPKKAALTTDTARRFSIELPKRCTVDWNNQSVVSVVPAEKIEIVRLNTGDPLPTLSVSDYEFKQLTVKQALDKLLVGTDVDVVEDGDLIEKITGTITAGDLSDAVELMSRMGRVYYSYDATAGEIHLNPRAKWMIKMPKDESIKLLERHNGHIRNAINNITVS